MPELPEVETVRRRLVDDGIVGRRIDKAIVAWPRTVGGDPETFDRVILGRRIDEPRRRGKYLRFPLDDGSSLLVHLRMSGRLWIATSDSPLTGYERVRLRLDDHRELRFHDPRKFGRMLPLPSTEHQFASLGFEPLEGTESERIEAWKHITSRRRMIKSLLLDQSEIAGLGNIYTDEALWLARIAPDRRANQLSPTEVETLRHAVERVLNQGINNFGTALGTGLGNFILPDGSDQARNQDELSVFRRTGYPCTRCGTTIERIIVAGRSTHLCPQCQRTTVPIRRDSSS